MGLESYLDSLGSPGGALFAVAGFLSAAYLLGSVLLARHPLPYPAHGFVAVTLGIDVLILLALPWQGFGMLPAWCVQAIFGLSLAIAFVLGLRAGFSWVRQRPPVAWPLTPFLLLAILLWPNALSYPYSWDDLTYQIAVPMRWLRANSLEVFLDNPFSAFPGLNLIGNLLLLKAGGLLAPLLFSYAVGLILCSMVYLLMRPRLGPWPATFFALSIVLSLSFLMVATSAYAEPIILLQFASILFLLGSDAPWNWLLIGVFSGFALAVKLTGVIIPVALGVLLIVRAWRGRGKDGTRRWLGSALGFTAAVLAIAALFTWRAALAAGDPVYPYFAELFTDRASALATSEYHHDAGRLHFGEQLAGPWQTLRYYAATPALLTLGPIVETNYDGYFGLQCLIHIGLIGTVWVARRRQPAAERDPLFWVYLGFALLFYTFWFFTAQQSRFLLPGLLCAVLASSCAGPMLAGRTGKGLLAALLILTVASVPPRLLEQVVFGWQNLATGRFTRYEYLNAALKDDYLQACLAIRERTPTNAKILLIYEQRCLYVPRSSCEIGTPYFQERFFTPPDAIASDEDLMRELTRSSITHVLIAYHPQDPDQMPKYMELSKAFQERLGRLSLSYRLKTLWPDVSQVKTVNYALYEVDSRARAGPAER